MPKQQTPASTCCKLTRVTERPEHTSRLTFEHRLASTRPSVAGGSTPSLAPWDSVARRCVCVEVLPPSEGVTLPPGREEGFEAQGWIRVGGLIEALTGAEKVGWVGMQRAVFTWKGGKEIILRSNSPWGFYPFQPPDSPKGQVARVSGELPPCMTRGSPSVL